MNSICQKDKPELNLPLVDSSNTSLLSVVGYMLLSEQACDGTILESQLHYAGLLSIIEGPGVGITRVREKPACSRRARYSSSVRS